LASVETALLRLRILVSVERSPGESRPDIAPGQFVMLDVSDDGRGMNTETLAKVFEPFFTTKDESKGTGLGLSTVYGIVKQNEGFIDITRRPSDGTVVRIYLPRHSVRRTAAAASFTEEVLRGRGETVLLVEDEPVILELTATMLERLGYTVLAARSGEHALGLATDHDGVIELFVTDVVMLTMSGKEFAGLLLDKRSMLRVLLISGYSADIIAPQGVLDEGVHFLQKPFSMPALAAKVREVLES